MLLVQLPFFHCGFIYVNKTCNNNILKKYLNSKKIVFWSVKNYRTSLRLQIENN